MANSLTLCEAPSRLPTATESRVAVRRRLRFARRATIARVGDHLAGDRRDWRLVPFKATAGCGRKMIADTAEIRCKYGDDGPNAYVCGVATCGSVWACPVCSAKIRTRRQMEVELLATLHAAAGGSFAMLTLTVRHDSSHSLTALLDAQAYAWRTIQQDYRWRVLRKGTATGPKGGLIGKNGDGVLVGTVRSKEVTQGLAMPGGSWHPHDHILLLWRDGADHEAECAWIAGMWADLVDSRLGARPDGHGYHYLPMGADSAKYITKLAQESARGDLKGGARSVWHIVDTLAEGETWAYRAWIEYCAATKGKRAIQMSRGLRELYGLDPELSDEELALDTADGFLVEELGPSKLRRLMAAPYGAVPPMVAYLETIEQRCRDGLIVRPDIIELQTASSP